MLDKQTESALLIAQCNEMTEYFVYQKLSRSVRDPHNKSILQRIADEELEHYHFWKKYTHLDVKPNKFKLWMFYLISRIFGITFGIKLMERGEANAQVNYEEISRVIPAARDIKHAEHEHEKQLIDLIDEERLRYVGSIVLGLSDALVELTGALAGLTLTLQNTRLIAMAGLITGIAASLSMAGSSYLSIKSEGGSRDPLKGTIYTGLVYVLTVLFLIFPYLILEHLYFCLAFTLLNAVIVILIFTFYISVAKGISFKKRFLEMVAISFGVAALAFIIGFFVKMFLKVDA